MTRVSEARRVATKVLFRVASQGAWATPALDAEIGRAKPDRRDAGLATEITYGALRVLPALDRVLDAHLKKPKKTDPHLRAALRAAAYQLLHLSRAPAHAVVSDAVSIVRAERGPRLGAVANAVLRKVAAARPEAPAQAEAIIVPDWVEQSIRASLGAERADAFLRARRLPPPIGLRAADGDAEGLAAAIRAAHPDAEVEPSAQVPGAVSVRGVGDPRALPGYEEGRFAVQELGSQRIVDLVDPQPGERIADLCAGHGTKTLALAARVGSAGRVEAVDLYEEKLERLEVERARLGIEAGRVGARAVDLAVGTGGLAPASFDRVLIDAPCTGLGTVHRRPELLLRLGPGDPERLAALQRQLLATAVTLVKPGGRLVYAVCSPTREEVAPGLEVGGEAQALGPWLGEEMDAYQIVIRGV